MVELASAGRLLGSCLTLEVSPERTSVVGYGNDPRCFSRIYLAVLCRMLKWAMSSITPPNAGLLRRLQRDAQLQYYSDRPESPTLGPESRSGSVLVGEGLTTELGGLSHTPYHFSTSLGPSDSAGSVE